jgi:hypothetical protein
LSDESKKPNAGRRRVVLAGTALSVLSVSNFGSQVRQAQGQQPSPSPSTPPAAGKIVMVAPSDTIAAIQTKLTSIPAGGTLAFPANSALNFNGRTVRGKSGITILANGPVTINNAAGPGTGGAFDFGGLSSWTIRGRAPGEGFVFNGGFVGAASSTGGTVGNCVFNNQPSTGLNGSAIDMSGASFLRVINNDFNNVQGNCLAQYDWDNVTVDGNHFTNCYGPISVAQGADTSKGRNIKIVRNIISKWHRTGIEMIGQDPLPGYFLNLLIDNNWFVDMNEVGPIPFGTGPVSIVARGQVGTKISNNFFRLGPTFKSPIAAIEFDSKAGAGEIFGNLFEDYGTYALYDLGANVHDNQLWISSPPMNNDVVLTAKPADPAPPARIAW